MMLRAALALALLAAPAGKKKPAEPVDPGIGPGEPIPAFPQVSPPPAPSHRLNVHADRLSGIPKGKHMLWVWKGNVHAVRAAGNGQPPLHLRCDQLVAEAENQQRLDSATCTGNVQAVQGDRAGWGDQAIFDNVKGELVVTGHPRGQQGANTFRGDRVIFFVNSDRVEVENPVGTMEGELPTGGAEAPPIPRASRAEPKPAPKDGTP